MEPKVLVVEEDPGLLKIYRELLSREFSALFAQDAETGLKKLIEAPSVDVVVADLYMQGMDGIEFLIKARQHAPWSVGILITGRPTVARLMAAVNQANIFGVFLRKEPLGNLVTRVKQGLSTVARNRQYLKKSRVGLTREELLFFQTLDVSRDR
ncbi:MAG: response regulator [Desulfonatronovibrionaceae bacterium]